MNVPRKLIGRFVEITWMDPNNARGPIDTLKKGREALATWKEYGVVHDVTDNVVLIAHSYATQPAEDKPDELQRTAIHEALIEAIRVFQEEPRAQAEGT